MVLKFCEECGNVQTRQLDGTLLCRNGHKVIDARTKEVQKQVKRKKKERRKILLTFPPITRVVVLRIMIPKHRKPFTQACDDTPSFHIYEELNRMSEEYGPTQFKRIRGEFAGTNNHGYVLCDRSIKEVIQERIKTLLLADGSNFWLEEEDYSREAKRELIEELKVNMIKELDIE